MTSGFLATAHWARHGCKVAASAVTLLARMISIWQSPRQEQPTIERRRVAIPSIQRLPLRITRPPEESARCPSHRVVSRPAPVLYPGRQLLQCRVARIPLRREALRLPSTEIPRRKAVDQRESRMPSSARRDYCRCRSSLMARAERGVLAGFEIEARSPARNQFSAALE